MPLKRLTAIAETAPTTKSNEIPTIELEGDLVSRFNDAAAEFKQAEALKKSVQAELLNAGLQEFFAVNIVNPDKPLTSINLVDVISKKDGRACEPEYGSEIARLTFQNKYSASDVSSVEALFSSLKADVNAFAQETISASFDGSIFNTGPKLKFNPDVFKAFSEAIECVTKDLVKRGLLPTGTVSPLNTSKKVVPLATFHAERWAKFPAVESQEAIFETIKNTVTLTPASVKLG